MAGQKNEISCCKIQRNKYHYVLVLPKRLHLNGILQQQQQFIQLSNELGLCYPQLAELFYRWATIQLVIVDTKAAPVLYIVGQ